MRTRTSIALDKNDMANLNRLQDAVGLSGGKWDMTAEDRKVWNYITSNDFTLDDVQRFVGIIRKRVAEQIASAEQTPLIFVHDHQREVWIEGVRGNGRRAIELAEEFLDNIKTDLATSEHNDRRLFSPRLDKKKKTGEAA